MSNFSQALVAFNRMYGLPVNDLPTFLGAQRLKDLKTILQKELNEIDDIIAKAENFESVAALLPSGAPERALAQLEILTDVADLMGDLQVYCGSEMKKWGLPQDEILDIIMQSNMSKLGADGQPIIDATGKVQKGPNYWKPEPRIHALLLERSEHGEG